MSSYIQTEIIMHLKNGAVLEGGKYTIEKLLGQGGFGITYLAIQSGLNRKVAIKEFFMKDLCERDADTSSVTLGTSGSRQTVIRFKEKFIREAKTIASLRHSNIVNIHDVFEENGTAYYVMEYHDGGSLSSLDLPLSVEQASGYIRQIASALSYLHKRNTMHLDVKPSNILLDESGNAVLIDFGISKHCDDAGNPSTSTPGGLSHGYAPIEQYSQSTLEFSPTIDIYALGATLYKLLTGVTPPDANLLVSKPSLLFIPFSLPESIANIIRQSMSPGMDSRPQNIDQFMSLLDSALKTIVPTQKDEPIDSDPVVNQPDILEAEPVVDPSGDKTTLENNAVHDADNPARPASESSSQTPQSSPKKKSRKWLKWLLGIISVLFLIGLCADNDDESVSEPTGYYLDHGYVDLGLPSGLKWATCNVGASSPEEHGDYFAWGEISPKSEYYSSVSDGKSWGNIGGDSGRDAATANWGGDWRLPTKTEFEELLRECTREWTTQNGYNGYKVTGPNGQSIFLPAAGWRYGADGVGVGSAGDYWSSTPRKSNSDSAYDLYFNEDSHYVDLFYRYCGLSVRPVLEY